jgi:bifunctional non-homologous end joining protein LigD
MRAVKVTHADRIVFPEAQRTKGDVVAYYQRVAERLLPHLEGRPLSIKRYPRSIAEPGFFQKNVPAHYPASIERFPVPRSREATRKHGGDARAETLYPIIRTPEHVAYLANQGAVELHVPMARAPDLFHPDRIVIDLDPPPGALDLVRRAARIVRDALDELRLPSAPVATGSKGYHVIAPIQPIAGAGDVLLALQQLATLLVARHPDELTMVFRVARRGHRVFLDWLRNTPLATVVVPYSLRARPRATVAAPLGWDELDRHAPDAFTLDDAGQLLDRPDTVIALPPADPRPFLQLTASAFHESGLELETFDRFRS